MPAAVVAVVVRVVAVAVRVVAVVEPAMADRSAATRAVFPPVAVPPPHRADSAVVGRADNLAPARAPPPADGPVPGLHTPAREHPGQGHPVRGFDRLPVVNLGSAEGIDPVPATSPEPVGPAAGN
jgi:hypothetical protein